METDPFNSWLKSQADLYSLDPNPDSFSEIQSRLQKKKKRRRAIFWLSSAASLFIGFVFVSLYLTNSTNESEVHSAYHAQHQDNKMSVMIPESTSEVTDSVFSLYNAESSSQNVHSTNRHHKPATTSSYHPARNSTFTAKTHQKAIKSKRIRSYYESGTSKNASVFADTEENKSAARSKQLVDVVSETIASSTSSGDEFRNSVRRSFKKSHTLSEKAAFASQTNIPASNSLHNDTFESTSIPAAVSNQPSAVLPKADSSFGSKRIANAPLPTDENNNAGVIKPTIKKAGAFRMNVSDSAQEKTIMDQNATWSFAAGYQQILASNASTPNAQADLPWMKKFIEQDANPNRWINAYQLGVYVYRKIHTRFKVGTGLSLQTIAFSQFDKESKTLNGLNAPSTVAGTPLYVDAQHKRFDMSLTYLQLPVDILHSWNFGKSKLNLSAGFDLRWLLQSRSMLFSALDTTFSEISNTQGDDSFTHLAVGSHLELLYGLNISSKFDVMLGPSIRYVFSPMYKSNYTTSNLPFFVGLEARIFFNN
jgi:hypothetical protein